MTYLGTKFRRSKYPIQSQIHQDRLNKINAITSAVTGLLSGVYMYYRNNESYYNSSFIEPSLNEAYIWCQNEVSKSGSFQLMLLDYIFNQTKSEQSCESCM